MCKNEKNRITLMTLTVIANLLVPTWHQAMLEGPTPRRDSTIDQLKIRLRLRTETDRTRTMYHIPISIRSNEHIHRTIKILVLCPIQWMFYMTTQLRFQSMTLLGKILCPLRRILFFGLCRLTKICTTGQDGPVYNEKVIPYMRTKQ